MSDATNAGAVENQEQVQPEQTTTKGSPQVDSDNVSRLIEEKLAPLKSFYEEKIELEKKKVNGLDRKVSDYQKQLKKYETEKMTEEERLSLEKREISEAWNNIYRETALSKYQLRPDDDEDVNFNDYLYGESEEDVLGKAERLKKFIDNRIAKGIEKGVEERLAQGYKPRTGGKDGVNDDYSTMTKDELRAEASKIAKQPSSEEKSRRLKDLMEAQNNLFRR